MAKTLLSGRRRAHTTDVGIPPAPERGETVRPESARESNTHAGLSLRTSATRTNSQNQRPYRQEISPPETVNGSSSTISRASPLRLEPVNESWDDEKIGLALGSPSMLGPNSELGTNTWGNITMSPPLFNDPMQEKDEPLLKRKPSRWRKIGGLFKPKAPPSPPRVPFYEVRVNDQQLQTLDSADHVLHSRLLRNRPLIYDARPWPARSQSLPRDRDLEEVASQERNLNSPEPPSLGRNPGSYGDWGPRSEGSKVLGASQRGPPDAPTLNVSIPNVEMERYSVIFGSFYGKGSMPNSQVHSQRSRTHEQLPAFDPRGGASNDRYMPRRATSPGPSTSTTLASSKPTFKNNASQQGGSRAFPRDLDFQPLPAKLAAPPLFTSFEIRSRAGQASRLAEGSDESPGGGRSTVSYLSTTSSEYDDADAYENEDELAAGNDEGEDETVRVRVRPPKQEEPAWEMITPMQNTSTKTSPKEWDLKPAETISGITVTEQTGQEPSLADPSESSYSEAKPTIPLPFQETLRAPRVNNVSSLASTRSPPKPSLPPVPNSLHRFTSSIDSTDDYQTVEISIARSISVSKRKQVLVPIVSKPSALRSNERLVERRIATPTSEALYKGHRHEKSRVAVLENAHNDGLVPVCST